jgi:hypothetical protein
MLELPRKGNALVDGIAVEGNSSSAVCMKDVAKTC